MSITETYSHRALPRPCHVAEDVVNRTRKAQGLLLSTAVGLFLTPCLPAQTPAAAPQVSNPGPPPPSILRDGRVPDRPGDRVAAGRGRKPRTAARPRAGHRGPRPPPTRRRPTAAEPQRWAPTTTSTAGRSSSRNGNILQVNRDALYYGLGANAVAAGTVNIPGLNYNLNVGEAWFGLLAVRQTCRRRRGRGRRRPQRRAAAGLRWRTSTCCGRGPAGHRRPEPGRGGRGGPADGRLRQGRPGPEGGRRPGGRRTPPAGRRLLQAEADVADRVRPACPAAQPRPVHPAQADRRVGRSPPRRARTRSPLPDLIAIALLQRPELAARRAEIQRALYDLSLPRCCRSRPNVILGFSAGGVRRREQPHQPAAGVHRRQRRSSRPARGSATSTAGPTSTWSCFWTFRNLGVGNLALVRGGRQPRAAGAASGSWKRSTGSGPRWPRRTPGSTARFAPDRRRRAGRPGQPGGVPRGPGPHPRRAGAADRAGRTACGSWAGPGSSTWTRSSTTTGPSSSSTSPSAGRRPTCLARPVPADLVPPPVGESRPPDVLPPLKP